MPPVVTLTPHPALDWTLTVPGFALGAVHRPTAQRMEAGGKGVNVAARLAEAGVPVVATGYLGGDNAEPFDALFERAGIVDRFVRLDGPTRVAVKVVDPAGGVTSVNAHGVPPSLADRAALADTLAELITAGPIVVMAGSLPPGVGAAAYRDLAAMLRRRGCRVVLDTSGEPLARVLDAPAGTLPHVVKPNAGELAAALGRPLPDAAAAVDAARHVVARGADLVVVTRGAAGALFVAGDRAVEAVPPAVPVGSTVGAGDALLAGVVVAGLEGMDLAATARHATAAAVKMVAQERADLATWARRVEVREWPR